MLKSSVRLGVRYRQYHNLCDVSARYSQKLRDLAPYEKQFPSFINVQPAVRTNLYTDIETAVSEIKTERIPYALTDYEIQSIKSPSVDNHIPFKEMKISSTNLQKLGKSLLKIEINKAILTSVFEWDNFSKGKVSLLNDQDIVSKTIQRLGISSAHDKTLLKSFTLLLSIIRFKYGVEEVDKFMRENYMKESYKVISDEFM